MDASYVKQPDSPSMLHKYWEEPDQRNTYNNTSYYDTPKYVVGVLGGTVSKTSRRLPERRNHRHIITTLSRTQVVTAGAV